MANLNTVQFFSVATSTPTTAMTSSPAVQLLAAQAIVELARKAAKRAGK